MEFDDSDMNIFNELMEVIKKHSNFSRYEVQFRGVSKTIFTLLVAAIIATKKQEDKQGYAILIN